MRPARRRSDPDESAVRVSLPRPQVGTAPQHLLVTLLGDYWLDVDRPLPLGVLVDLLSEFGIGAANARAAVNRLCRRGLLASARSGRSAFYRIAPGMADEFAVGIHGALAFARQGAAWDGRWTLALFAVPDGRRDQRHALHSRLRSLGFAPLYDGSWISPRPVVAETVEVLTTIGLSTSTVFRAVDVPVPGGRRPEHLWNLAEAELLYREFLDQHGPHRPGPAEPGDALVRRTTLMDRWRAIPDADPRLPDALLPADWPRAEAFELFSRGYDELAEPAAERVRELVGRYDPGLAVAVRARTTDELDARGQVAIDRRTGDRVR